MYCPNKNPKRGKKVYGVDQTLFTEEVGKGYYFSYDAKARVYTISITGLRPLFQLPPQFVRFGTPCGYKLFKILQQNQRAIVAMY